MENDTDVSIVIVNYNVKDLLQKCIESICKFTNVKIKYEIIVVDNNSTDGSQVAIEAIFPDVIFIKNNFNAGFPAANNQGINLSKGRFIFLLNPDTELTDDTLSSMIHFMEMNGKTDIIAPQLLNSDMTIQNSIFRFPRISYIMAEMIYLDKLVTDKYYSGSDLNEAFEVESASGAALFFGRDLIDRIGLLNEKLFWIEDIDFCYRVVKAGGKVLYYPNSRIIHHSGQSAKKNYNVSISNMVINKIKFYKVHGSAPELVVVYILSFFNAVIRFIVFCILSPFNKVYYLKMKAYYFTIGRIFKATSDL